MWHQRFGHSREEMTPGKYAGTALIIIADGLIGRGLFVDKKQFDRDFRGPLSKKVGKGLVTGDSLHLALTDPARQWTDGEDPTREWAAIATAYAIEAIMAEHDGHQARAWTYAVDAMFAANASRSGAIGDAVLRDARAERAARASSNGKVGGKERSREAVTKHSEWCSHAKKLQAEGTARHELAGKVAARFTISTTHARTVLIAGGILEKRKKRN